MLVKLDPAATGPVGQALQIIAVKQADLVKKQQEEREDWQRRGVGGLVKSVDSAAGTIVLNSGAGPMQKTITVHTTAATILKRYARDRYASMRRNRRPSAPSTPAIGYSRGPRTKPEPRLQPGMVSAASAIFLEPFFPSMRPIHPWW